MLGGSQPVARRFPAGSSAVPRNSTLILKNPEKYGKINILKNTKSSNILKIRKTENLEKSGEDKENQKNFGKNREV